MYQRIVFCQGDDAKEPLRILEELGDEAAVKYLSQWDFGPGDLFPRPSSGDSDWVYESHDYRLSYDTRLTYIGLERIVAINYSH